MKTFSTTQAARKLGIDPIDTQPVHQGKKGPGSEIFEVSGSSLHAWTEEEIEKRPQAPAQDRQRQENAVRQTPGETKGTAQKARASQTKKKK